MGNLSEHFNSKNFVCRCGQCQDKFKTSLTLVGILETIFSRFDKPVKIIEAFRCPDNPHLLESVKMDPHAHGKAADINIDGVPLPDLFDFVQKIPEISGIGFNPQENFIHIEVGPHDRRLWLGEGLGRQELTEVQAAKYQLKIENRPEREKQLARIKSIENEL